MTHILIVEDDVTTQFMMSEFIDTLGYGCEVVGNARACLDTLLGEKKSFDLVLLDIHMPGMNGLALAQAIRAAPEDPPRSIPIIAVTADAAFHNKHAISSYGVDAVLPKPIELSALDLTIQKHVN